MTKKIHKFNNEFSWEPLYNVVFTHYKEQAILRNTTIAAFATITGILYKMEVGITVSILLFIVGFVVQIITCRHKYYSKYYYATLLIMNTLFLIDIKSLSQDDINDLIISYMSNEKKEKDEKLIKNIFIKLVWSADGLVFLIISLVNVVNLNIIFLNRIIFVIVSFLYLIITAILYLLLVWKSFERLEPENFKFLQIYSDEVCIYDSSCYTKKYEK